MKGQGESVSGTNRLANFAITSAVENKHLGGVAPSRYRDRMPASKLRAILDAAICPPSLFDDDYGVFLQERSEMLHAVVRRLTA